jgi:hypothetical protein
MSLDDVIDAPTWTSGYGYDPKFSKVIGPYDPLGLGRFETARTGNDAAMTMVAELQSCDGFSIEGADGLLGWVEETWLDDSGHPAALAIRTTNGLRALLPRDAVRAVDLDTQQVIVAANPQLQELDAPRVATADSTLAASWRTTGALVHPDAAASALPPEALAASRTLTTHHERPLWQIAAFALTCLAALVAFVICLDFFVAYLVTGHAY